MRQINGWYGAQDEYCGTHKRLPEALLPVCAANAGLW